MDEEWREVSFNPTFDVEAATVVCECGCGALTRVPFRGALQAHIWPDQIRFTFKVLSRTLWWMLRIRMWLTGGEFKGLLVLLEFTDGRRIQCSPTALRLGHRDFCTERPCQYQEIAKSTPR